MSEDRFNVTWFDKQLALENRFRYLEAKLNDTGWSTSRVVDSISFPLSCWFKVALPVPISPEIENFIFYFVVSILIDSERLRNYLQILENYPEGNVTIEVKSVSGIPIPSESILMRDRLNSDNF